MTADRPAGGGATDASDMARLGTGAGISVTGRLGGRGLHFTVQVVLATALGPAAFGLYSLGWTLLRFASFLATLGFQHAVVHFAAGEWVRNPARARSVARTSILLGVGCGTLVGLAFYLGADWMALSVFRKPEATPVFRLMAFAFPLLAGSQIAAAATRASQRMTYSVLAEDVGQPVTNLLAVGALVGLLDLGLRGAAGAAAISFAGPLALALYFLHRLLRRAGTARPERPVPVADLLRFSLPTALAGALGVYVLWVDRLFVGYFQPAAELGVYQAASQLTLPFSVVLAAFNIVLAPMVVDLFYDGGQDRLQAVFRVSTKWGLYLCLPAFLIFLGAGRPLIELLFGPEYAGGYPVLVILGIGQLINVATGAVGILLIMTGHQRVWLVITALSLTANVLLNWWLVPSRGAEGAALATSLAMGGMFVAGLATTRATLRLWPYDVRYLKGGLATLAAGAGLLLVRSLAPDGPALLLSLTVIAVPAIFTLTLLLCGLDSEDRLLLDLLRARLGRRRG